jgi:hypothetical protein
MMGLFGDKEKKKAAETRTKSLEKKSEDLKKENDALRRKVQALEKDSAKQSVPSNGNGKQGGSKARGEGYGPPLANVSEMIGNTPMIKLSDRMTNIPGVTIYAKAEYCNPLSSVKDRLALAIIETAEKGGKLKPGGTVVEATSGNTGIAIAMMCAQRGYKCVSPSYPTFPVSLSKDPTDLLLLLLNPIL